MNTDRDTTTAETTDRRCFTITCVRRDPDGGYWRARVTNGTTVNVDRRYGAWQAEVRAAPGSRQFVRREVMPEVAKALQRRVRPLERAERVSA